MPNPIYTNDVLHLAKEIVARYGISTTQYGSLIKKKSTMEKHAMRSPTGRYIAANMDEFTQICIRLGWITHTSVVSGIQMLDSEFCIDWDRIHRDQVRAAARRERETGDGRVATPSRPVTTGLNRRVVLYSRGGKGRTTIEGVACAAPTVSGRKKSKKRSIGE